MRANVCVCVHMRVHMRVHMHVHMCVHMRLHVRVHMRVRMRVHMRVHASMIIDDLSMPACVTSQLPVWARCVNTVRTVTNLRVQQFATPCAPQPRPGQLSS